MNGDRVATLDNVDQLRLLVIRHEAGSELGFLEKVLHHHSIPYDYLDTPQGETLAGDITAYSHLIILGGAIGAYEDEQYPFLRDEFALVERAIAHRLPTLGICLGAQILARVLGAKVYRGAAGREVGWCEMQLTDAARHDPLFGEFPARFEVFESHQDTFDLPLECDRLVESALYPNQAFRYRDHVWAIQFHLEMNERVLQGCGSVIEQELVDSQIQHITLAQLLAGARQYASSVEQLADQFMEQFLQCASPVVAASSTRGHKFGTPSQNVGS